MNSLIGAWSRRLLLAMGAIVLTFGATLAWMLYTDGYEPQYFTDEDLMRRLVHFPLWMGMCVFVVSTFFALCVSGTATAKTVAMQPAPAETAKPFVAQVVGLEWLNPLQRRDYPTEWQILWTLGLVKPNKNDDMVRTDPASFTSLQPVAGIAYGNRGRETFDGFYEKYIDKLLGLFDERYVMNGKYFYTVKPDDRKKWRELAGIHVEFAIPSDRLDPTEAATFLRDEIVDYFEIGTKAFPDLWSKATPPDVRVTPGGPNAGFASLNAALDYLQAHPQESVWVMNWDAPSFPPKDNQLNENIALLILAGPEMKTERAPLAWIGKAAAAHVNDYEKKAGTTRAVQAWKAAIAAAANNSNVSVNDIDYVLHDAGKGSDEASQRIGTLGRTLTETLPELDFQKQTFNTAGLLGYMGAGTALTNVVLAIGRANHLGGNVLVAGTTTSDQPVAVVITPPEKLNPIDPDADWFRARGESNAYLPWWGRRYDETYYNQQGWSW
ncbi:virulence factor [Trinickia symbiotica]|uniref:Virulence factor n=1 Tax=Trinickia symbiotica TaxID=863227 RepID=A0A2T3XZC2_9BURK|nr:virulence factor [Trinickia symbiotica]PTB21867.1 virulence factor [Trinickia symbiotica]